MRKAILWITILCMVLCLSGCSARRSGENNETSSQNEVTINKEITADTKVVDVINDEDFQGFGQYLFPVEDGMPDENMTLDNIDSLLPYHSHINVNTTIDVIRSMKNEVENGETIFYDIYTDEEKEEDPSKEDTGLFFFRGKENAPFAVVNAGGGFSYVDSIHESFPHALELSRQGYNAFALQYRTGGEQEACEDLAAAISYIFEHADE